MSVQIESAVSEENLKALETLAATAPPGDFAEVGVYKGGSAVRLYAVCEAQGRTLHLFDSFRGMPVFTEGLDAFKLGSFMVDRDTPNVLKALMPNATFHIGIYPATHPVDMPKIAFLHVDCDQYLSYRAVIDNLWPLVVHGGMMLWDDYPYLGGAKKAVEETFSKDNMFIAGDHFYVIKAKATEPLAENVIIGEAVASLEGPKDPLVEPITETLTERPE